MSLDRCSCGWQADLCFVQGKESSNRSLGGSYVLGAGLQFSDVIKF